MVVTPAAYRTRSIRGPMFRFARPAHNISFTHGTFIGFKDVCISYAPNELIS
jgi:hypothetical protein